jgi:hypothetical protein
MRFDSATLVANTIVSGSFEITGTTVPGDNSSYDLGSVSKSWRTIYSTALSGSLTKLASGADYLVAAGNVVLTTGSNGSISIATVNSGTIHGVTAGTGLTGGGASGTVSLTLSNTGSAGSYGSASSVPVFTTDAQGRVTAVSPTSIQVTQAQVTNLTSDLSNRALTSTTVSAGTGLTGGGDLSTNRTLSINDAVVATVSGATFTGAVNFNSGLSGSLTKLSNGSDYLVAGSGINLATGSSGAVTISSNAVTSPGGLDTYVQFKDGSTFGGNSGLTYNKTAQALTGTYIVASTGFSGSLTKLSTGGDYLIAGTGIVLSTGSSGAVTITSAVAGSSLIGGSDTQVQFNDASSFAGDNGLTYNKTTQTLTGKNIVVTTGFSGSLTKLSTGADYLVGGSGITISTGSNGSVTMSLGAVSYATASFTAATSVTVNHPVGTTLYDIEVFDTSYSKIIPKSSTATSPTQANITFGSPTSGFVAVGSPTAGGAGASTNTLLVTGSAYLASETSVAANNTTTLVTFTLPSAGTWDVTYFVSAYSVTTAAYALGSFALYDSGNVKVANSEVIATYVGSTVFIGDQNSGRIFITTAGSATYTLRLATLSASATLTARNDTVGKTGVVWTSMGGSTGVSGIGATNFLPLFNTATALTASNIQVSGTDVNFLTSSIVMTNGYGIRLPSSGSNTNANTLDCYEEGQATSGMTYTGVTVTGGSVVTTATWTKLGRGMFLHVTIGPQSGQAITFASSWQINLSAVTGYPNFYTASSPITVAAVWVGGNVDQANAWYSASNRIIYGTNAAMGNSAWTNVGYTMSCFIPF